MKKICAAITAASMLLSSANVAYADNTEDSNIAELVEARYAYTAAIDSLLSIYDREAICSSSGDGLSGVTKIEATQYLEKSFLWWWDPVDDWSHSASGNTIDMRNTKENLGNGTYRLRTVFTVYVNGNSETVECISKEVTI